MKFRAFVLPAMILITFSFGVARAAGPGEGGGQGDHAFGDSMFAIQELAKRNPTLNPEQVLFKAFKESQGRLPKIQVVSETPYYYFGSFLPGAHEVTISVSGGWIEHGGGFDFAPSYIAGPSSSERLIRNFYVTKEKIEENFGPLIQAPEKKWYLHTDTFGQCGFECQNNWGSLESTGTGLVSSTKKSFQQIEFRQYTKDIVVFVIYPFDNRFHNGRTCFERDEPNKDGVCIVGYFWKR